MPVTFNCGPVNVKLLLSCNAPELPASTTRPDVKSLTVAEDNVVSPPVTDNPLRRVAVYGELTTFELMITALPIYPCAEHW